jgi:hypothetical protein
MISYKYSLTMATLVLSVLTASMGVWIILVNRAILDSDQVPLLGTYQIHLLASQVLSPSPGHLQFH